MKKTKAELSRIARRAVATRVKKIKHVKSQQAGKKAWKEAIDPSEHNYIDELTKILGISRKCIFHHEGLPDLMAITDKGRMRFYEIKPKKGSLERRMLSPKQAATIMELLGHEYVEEVNLVQYQKEGKQIRYESPIRLTKSNINDYSNR